MDIVGTKHWLISSRVPQIGQRKTAEVDWYQSNHEGELINKFNRLPVQPTDCH